MPNSPTKDFKATGNFGAAQFQASQNRNTCISVKDHDIKLGVEMDQDTHRVSNQIDDQVDKFRDCLSGADVMSFDRNREETLGEIEEA